MTLIVDGKPFDTMKEACARIGISRQTFLRYLAEGFFTEPRKQRQGRGKQVRIFDEGWYAINEAALKTARGE